ncbi:MAG TPA: patatin-like phospholipase family protein [Tepiditoga sp.]|nr:patatin-like phospholipase family protein [Tepiditoga sp.]
MIYGAALGSGGIRGIAHLSFLEKIIEKNNIELEILTGSSAGALASALYSLNPDSKYIKETFFSVMKYYNNQLTKLMKSLSSGVASYSKLITSTGIEENNILYNIYKDLFGRKTFSDTKKKLGIVSYSVEYREEIKMTEGYIIDAVMASSNVPGAFIPHRIGGMNLLDGGVLDEVPVDFCRELGAEYVFANNISPKKVKSSFSNGYDYFSYVDDRKIGLLTEIQMKNADKAYTFSYETDWFSFNKLDDIYNASDKFYGGDNI